MPVPVLVVALVLIMSGLAAFVMGLSLMPTDMSRAWLIVGSTLFSGGMVALAMGFAAQTLANTWASAGLAPIGSRDTGPVEPTLENPPPVEAEGQGASDKGLGHAGLIAAGGALLGAGAGALAAHSAQEHGTQEHGTQEHASPQPEVIDAVTPPAPLDEFERELFSAEQAEKAAAESPVPAFPELNLRLSPVLSEPETATAAEEAPEPLPSPALLPQDEPLAAQEPLLEAPLPEERALEAHALREDAPENRAIDDAGRQTYDFRHHERAPDPDWAETAATGDEPEDDPEEHGVHLAHPAVAGLIADDDLAALQDSEPPLAPLSTLDIVGAYDSGGVRFTMYSDGSVHAAGASGEKRYASLEALRKRLDAGLPAV